MKIKKEKEQKLINLAKAIDESLFLFGIPLVDEAGLSWVSISLAGIFRTEAVDFLQELQEMGIISDFRLSEWPEYPNGNKPVTVEGFKMEVNTKKLGLFIGTDESTKADKVLLPKISVFTEKGVGYIKSYKEGPKIRIGNVKSRKFRLLKTLIEPLGVAKNIDVVFEAIKLSKDEKDKDLADNYLSYEKKARIVEFTMKELQKIKGLKTKIKLKFVYNKKSVLLQLSA